jgi:hypothetical protein
MKFVWRMIEIEVIERRMERERERTWCLLTTLRGSPSATTRLRTT